IVLLSAFMDPQLSPEERKGTTVGGPVGGRGRYGQHRLGAGTRFAPEFQFAAQLIRAFPYARQPEMSGAPAGLEDFGINSFSVVADVHAELAAVIADLHLDPARLSVAERVAQQF